jgi:NitT/TauT family transport system substrate-binding protein
VVLSGGEAAIQALAADRTGMAFAWGNVVNLLALKTNSPDAPELVSVASTGHLNPYAFVFLESSGITRPSDLAGRVVAVAPGSTSARMLPVFLKRNGLEGKIRVEQVGLTSQIPALLAKKVDALFTIGDKIASIAATARGINEELGYFFVGEYGMPPPGFGIVVRKQLVTVHPDVVKAIVNSTMNGFRFCILETRQCAADFVNQYPAFDADQVFSQNQVLVNVWFGYPFNDTTVLRTLNVLQLGWHDPVEMARVVTLAEEVYGFSQVDAASLYTNQFVEPP